jgi:S-formylglutathione hydrolase FrmB
MSRAGRASGFSVRFARHRPALRRLLLAGCCCAALLSAAQPARAAGRVECGAVESRLMKDSVRYCALLPAGYDSAPARRYPVVYYLHGLGDNEQSLIHLGGWSVVEELRQRGRIGDFIILAPDGGRSFYVNSRDAGRPYSDFFLREFVPLMEKKYRVLASRSARALLGISMGGYGALRFALENPDRFGAVAAHMAALIEKVPAGVTDLRAIGPRLGILNEVFGRPFDRAYWDRNSPIAIAARAPGLARLKIYFDCGSSDEYGFDSGARALNKTLVSRKIEHEFHIYPGGHSWAFVSEHLPASIEFLSRAISAAR